MVMPNIDIEALDDKALDDLATKLLGVGDDDEPEAEGDGAKEPEAAGGSEGGGDEPEPQADPAPAPAVTPTGKALLDALTADPEAQKLVKAQLDKWVADASASAEAKAQQDELQKLIEAGDYEEIGKRFINDQQQQALRTAAEQEALTRAYTGIYQNLFTELNSFELTPEEKLGMAPDKFDTDEAYILHLSTLISTKKAGGDVETLAQQKAEEILKTLANQKAGAAANGNSPSNIPGATETAGGERKSSRSLIIDGFREEYEQRAESRVMT